MKKIIVLILALLFAQSVVTVSAGPLNSFAENPIPYWDNQSSNVTVTWDSTDQTVEIAYGSVYLEDMSDVSDWTASHDPITTDGDIANITTSDDYTQDLYTDNTPSGSYWTGLTAKVKVRTNATGTVQLQFVTKSADDGGGVTINSVYFFTTTSDTSWHIYSVIHTDTHATEIVESVQLRTRSDKNVSYQIDWLIIGIPDLDIGIPITDQETQFIEFYINSTNLISEVRLEIYDDTEALDTYCMFNNTHVIFPDSEYAQTDGLSRIAFRLDNARMIGTITVFDADGILINQYNDTTLLSGTTFLRMNDSVFFGSFTLFYINGDTTYSAEFSIIEELFLSTDMIGYIGPLLLVFAGWFLVKKDKGLGVIAFIVESLFVAQYLALVGATPDYWWQILILIFGMLFTVVFPLWDR